MKHTAFFTVVILLSAAAARAADDTGPPTDPASLAQIKDAPGQMVWRKHRASKTDVRWGEVDGIIEHPLPKVVGAITTYDRYKEIFPFFTKSEVTERKGKTSRMKGRGAFCSCQSSLAPSAAPRRLRQPGANSALDAFSVQAAVAQ